MITLIQITAATFVISLISLIGVLTFYVRAKLLSQALPVLVALSTGALLGGAFLHLLPEAIAKAGVNLNIFLSLLLGFCLFFILEQFLRWHHQHNFTHGVQPFSYLILVGDGVHNFIDGLAIAAAFIMSYPTGIATALAVALHEIPQELGDFGILVHGGFGRGQALAFNYISAVTAILGGIAGYFVSSAMQLSLLYLLPFAAGSFIYIGASDLIPEIKYRGDLRTSIIHICTFLAGLGIMLAIK